MMAVMLRALVLVLALAGPCSVSPALAQAPAIATVAVGFTLAEAPVYARAERLPTPLRVLPRNTRVRVLQVRGGWAQISFDDPQWGERYGWVEERLLRVDRTVAPTPPEQDRARVAPGDARRPPAAGTSAAQAAASRRPPANQPGARVIGGISFMRMAAAEGFEAVTGSSTILHYGGGVQGYDVWKHLFVEGTIEYGPADGERVFVHEGEVFPLGIPLEVTMLPIDMVAGWRFASRSPITPYVGGGYSLVNYRESSEFAEEGDDLDEWHSGFVVMGGIEVRASRLIAIRGEAKYREVPGGLDGGGAASALGETSLGGFAFGVKVAIGR